MDSMASSVTKPVLSPTTLVTAVLFGAAIHRARQVDGRRFGAVLETLNVGFGLLQSASLKSNSTEEVES